MAKGADTRRRILDGARELIHAHSYNAVGVLYYFLFIPPA